MRRIDLLALMRMKKGYSIRDLPFSVCNASCIPPVRLGNTIGQHFSQYN
ncbi:hypothetical protein [Vibrio sp.]